MFKAYERPSLDAALGIPQPGRQTPAEDGASAGTGPRWREGHQVDGQSRRIAPTLASPAGQGRLQQAGVPCPFIIAVRSRALYV